MAFGNFTLNLAFPRACDARWRRAFFYPMDCNSDTCSPKPWEAFRSCGDRAEKLAAQLLAKAFTGALGALPVRHAPSLRLCTPIMIPGWTPELLLSKIRRSMPIQKQEFYEGAALHQLIRGSSGAQVTYSHPLFVLDERLQVHLKYSTAKRSPWAFTFMPDEQMLLQKRAETLPLVIGLVCGANGVATLPYEDYLSVASMRHAALRVSCRRNYREYFEIGGPDGVLPGKVAPSDWANLMARGGKPR